MTPTPGDGTAHVNLDPLSDQLSDRLLTPAEAQAAFPDRHRRAAVALALRAGDDGLSVLLMQRAERAGDRWSGQISLPGGHEEPEDQTLVDTAIRETQEEVGVDLTAYGKLLGALAPLQARARGRRLSTTIAPFVFEEHTPAEVVLGPEAADAFWFPIAPAAAGDLDDTYRYERDGERGDFPCWRWEGRVVWGLTWRILSDLIGRARP